MACRVHRPGKRLCVLALRGYTFVVHDITVAHRMKVAQILIFCWILKAEFQEHMQ